MLHAFTAVTCYHILSQADFSWSAALLGPPGGEATRRPRLTVTSYDSREEIARKYGERHVAAHLDALREAGATVLHRVDATSLPKAALLPERAPFDVIVFQFQHVGADEVCDGM